MNDYLRRVLDAAEANGWEVLEYDGLLRSDSRSGHIVLMDRRGGHVTIETQWGMDTEAYIRSFHAIPPRTAVTVEP